MSQDIQEVLKEYSFWKKRVIVLQGDIEELQRGIKQVAGPATSHIDGMTWENTALWVQASIGFCRKHASKALEHLAHVYFL